MSDWIAEADVSVQRLNDLFQAAYFRCSVDDDGDLCIEEEGVRIFVKVDSQRRVLNFFSIWGLKASAPEMLKLTMACRLNDSMLLVRFSLPKPDRMWCDYQLLYEGGVGAHQIIATFRRFLSVCRMVPREDTDGLIGSD